MAALWDKMTFWKKPKMLEENVDYRFVNFEGNDITGVELLLDSFKGVVYHYGRVRVKEEGAIARLEFGYTIVYPGEHDMNELDENEKFQEILGDILNIILLEQINYESTRNNNSEEPDLY